MNGPAGFADGPMTIFDKSVLQALSVPGDPVLKRG
jgi:hypothetical protein